MQIVKVIFSIFFIISLVACTKQVPSDNVAVTIKENIFKKEEIITKTPKYLLTKKEIEFLDILERDKYASLCGNLDEYLHIKNMANSKEKSILLKELFYNYANNLNNSCIDQESFQSTLKKPEYKNNKQFYEMYNAKLDKDSLLIEYSSEDSSVENILKKYTPSHPDFFKLIKKLDMSKLSKLQYNKLRLNIERLKLLKYAQNDNFIQLNVPSYNFSFYEEGEKTRSFGTVVGEKESQTPILSSKLSYFIINPTWNIPDSIAKETIIPNALKDKNYLKRKNIVIRENYKLDSKEFKFKDIKWKKYLKKHVKYIPYKFIQLPSNTNGMGRVKFMFPNDYAVYMHDTIGSWRFKSNKEKIRFVSHGCVRLEHPISFMKHLTTNYTPKSYKNIRKTYLNNEMETVGLSKKIPVHITYLTSSIKKDGNIIFHKDVYGYDKIQKLNFSPYSETALLFKKNLNKQIN